MDEVARHWDSQAADFDDQPDHGLRDPDVRAAWLRLLSGALPVAPARLADLGCGTGTLSVLLAQQGYHVTGIDLAPKMIELARRKAHLAGVDVDLRIGDAADPPLASGGFDVVLARHVLWALPDPGSAVARWIDLLREDGLLMLVEGRWCTGAGLTASTLLSLVGADCPDATLIELDDPIYWGSPIDDERYAIVGRRTPRHSRAHAPGARVPDPCPPL